MEQTDRQKRAGRTGKSQSRDLTIFERVFCSSGELLTETLFELLSSLEERLKRLNAHVKSCLVKGRNVLCIRFPAPARILCRQEKHGAFSRQGRKKEHMDKVRLTNEDLHKRKHSFGREMDGQSGVDQGNAEIVARERVKAKKSYFFFSHFDRNITE